MNRYEINMNNLDKDTKKWKISRYEINMNNLDNNILIYLCQMNEWIKIINN